MRTSKSPAFIPAFIPESEVRAFVRGGMGRRMGFGNKVALIIVDTTHGFVDPGSSMSCGTAGLAAIKSIATVLEKVRGKSMPIVYTRCFAWSGAEAGRWLEKGSGTGQGSIMQNDRAHHIVGELQPKPGEIIITKAKPSAFFGTQLVGLLTYYGIDTVIITGLVTSGCVRATVVDAFSYNYRVIVPIECVADRGEVTHQVNLFDMDMKYADVIPLCDVLDAVASY